jgi:tetratricopeptide (TPR) repeat protein
MKKCAILLFMLIIGESYSQSVVEKAEIYLKQNHIVQAKSILTEQVSENNTNLDVLELLGDIASFEKKWDTAISNYKKLVTAQPKNASFNLKYGGAIGMKALSVSRLQALVYISDIKKYLELAAEQDRTQIESRRALVELYVQLPGFLGGSDERATMYAEELKDLSPVNAYLAKGFIVKENQDASDAIKYYKNAFNLYRASNNTKSSNSLNYEFGKVSAELKLELNYGSRLLDEYIKNYSYKDIYSMEWVYLRKAQISANLKNKESALKYIEMALTLRGDFKEALREKDRIQDLLLRL